MRRESSTENLGWAVKMPIIHIRICTLAHNIAKSILQYHLYIYICSRQQCNSFLQLAVITLKLPRAKCLIILGLSHFLKYWRIQLISALNTPPNRKQKTLRAKVWSRQVYHPSQNVSTPLGMEGRIFFKNNLKPISFMCLQYGESF